MLIRQPLLMILLIACLSVFSLPARANESANLFFLHNSVGNLLIEQGEMRQYLDQHNIEQGTDLRFWDHNYPYIGIRNPGGQYLDYAYSSVCGHNTEPDGLHLLWLDETMHPYVDARDSIMTKHDVIAFKSCYRAIDFGGAETQSELHAALEQYKQLYLEMRDVFDLHPDKIFVPISIPPRHRLHEEATAARAAHGRLFANWLNSSEFLGYPPRSNVLTFDLFDLLAEPDDGGPTANMLRSEYERSPSGTDSHPNELANSIIGPLLMQLLIDAADQQAETSVQPLPATVSPVLWAYPNPFNPITTLQFELTEAMHVSLEILDIRGRLMTSLKNGNLPSGQHRYTWDGRHHEGYIVASGIYLGRLKTGRHDIVKILTLVK
jgi:hypothetical protein